MKGKITCLLMLALLLATGVRAGGRFSLTGYGEGTNSPQDGQSYVIQGFAQNGTNPWMYDNGAAVKGLADNLPTGVEAMKYVWTFHATGTDGKYTVTNAYTGRYMDIAGTGNNGAVLTGPDERFVIVVRGGNGLCALRNGNVEGSTQCIDVSQTGANPCTWEGWVDGSRRMQLYVAEVEEVSDHDALLIDLGVRLNLYDIYIPNYGTETIDRGEGVGQYNCSDADYDKFIRSITLAQQITSGEAECPGDEELRQLIADIDNSWQAIMDSIVTLDIPEGNYRVVSAQAFTNTVTIPTDETDSDGNPVTKTVTTHPVKAMYATLENDAMWGTVDSADCRFLWHVSGFAKEKGTMDGTGRLMNLATDGHVKVITQSQPVKMDSEADTEMYFKFIRRAKGGRVEVAISCSKQRGGNVYLHCRGHNNGTGEGNALVGWGWSETPSQWILEPVDDETAARLMEDFEPYKNRGQLASNYQKLVTRAEAAVTRAKDDTYAYSVTGDGLFTEPSQFSSPFTTADNQCANPEDTYAFLLNNNRNRYWHSAWEGGNVPAHTHYFQIALAEPTDEAQFLRAYILRRNYSMDHITAMSVYGADSPGALESATEEGWTKIADISSPWNSSQTEVTTNCFGPTGGAQYLRFYIDDTAGTGLVSTRGYGHMAGFQLYPVTKDGNTQYSQMGDLAARMDSALAVAKAADTDSLTMADYEALKALVEEYEAALVDNSALLQAVNASQSVADNIVIGTEPGYWSEGSGAEALAGDIAQARAYLKSGAYTHERTDALLTGIKASADAALASANKVEEGKWYAIRFCGEDMYDAHGWAKGNAENGDLGDLYDTYLAPANEADGALTGLAALRDVKEGQPLRFISEDLVSEPDQVAFRFVAQGDTAFVLQHKSGLYVEAGAASSAIRLGLTPALFHVAALGLGKVAIHARDLKGNETDKDGAVYLHAQNAGHSLVTWYDNEASSNSGLLIQSVEDSFAEGDDAAGSILRPVQPNSMRVWCYPVGYSVATGKLYAYKGCIEGQDEVKFVFDEVASALPGCPVLYVHGDPDAFDKDAESEDETLTLAPGALAADPADDNGLQGTYTYQWVDEGSVVVSGGDYGGWGSRLEYASGEDGTDCTRDVSANTGSIDPKASVLEGDDARPENYALVLTVPAPGGSIDGIRSLGEVVSKSTGAAYNLQGQRVTRAKGGVYIIGGRKVAVK